MICGPSGTGKSHLLEALGQNAIDAKKTVVWYSIEDLGLVVRRQRIDDTVAKGLAPILRADVIVIDDIGLLPITEDAAAVFIASSMPPTNVVPSPSARICTPRVLTN